MLDSKMAAAGERHEDHATRREIAAYWIGRCREMLQAERLGTVPSRLEASERLADILAERRSSSPVTQLDSLLSEVESLAVLLDPEKVMDVWEQLGRLPERVR